MEIQKYLFDINGLNIESLTENIIPVNRVL